MSAFNLYDTDFYAWTQEQAQLLRNRALSNLDIEHLIEEVESMGVSEKRELESRLEVLLMYLLKWKYQPTHRGMSWELTIKEQRKRLQKHLRDNPSLSNESIFNAKLIDAYETAVLRAAKETKLSIHAFTPTCEWGNQQILDNDFYPQ